MNPVRRLAQLMYSKKVLPYTNTATGMVFFGIGDLVVQKVAQGRRITEGDVDWKRFTVSCLAGTYMGFVGHFWYSYLDRRFPGYTGGMVRRKLFAEMLVGPPFAASMFLLVGSLERKNLSTIWTNTKDNILYLLMADWGFYIPMQVLNFKYLPSKFRVLYVAAISIVYDSALVYLLHKDDINSNSTKPKVI